MSFIWRSMWGSRLLRQSSLIIFWMRPTSSIVRQAPWISCLGMQVRNPSHLRPIASRVPPKPPCQTWSHPKDRPAPTAAPKESFKLTLGSKEDAASVPRLHFSDWRLDKCTSTALLWLATGLFLIPVESASEESADVDADVGMRLNSCMASCKASMRGNLTGTASSKDNKLLLPSSTLTGISGRPESNELDPSDSDSPVEKFGIKVSVKDVCLYSCFKMELKYTLYYATRHTFFQFD